jgi:hypothetical protein
MSGRKRIVSARVDDPEAAFFGAAAAARGYTFLSDWIREGLVREATRVLGRHFAQHEQGAGEPMSVETVREEIANAPRQARSS